MNNLLIIHHIQITYKLEVWESIIYMTKNSYIYKFSTKK